LTFAKWQGSKRLISTSDEALEYYCCAEGTEQVRLYPGGLVIECGPRNTFRLQLPIGEVGR
jgi:hypothetical protein